MTSKGKAQRTGYLANLRETIANDPRARQAARKALDGITEELARVPVSTRISPAGVQAIEEMAAAERRTRSTMIRILLEEAVASRRRAGR